MREAPDKIIIDEYHTECDYPKDPILVWRFYDAPVEFRELSPHGGDEDWLAVIPAHMINDCDHPPYIGWMESGTAFGCCGVEEYKLPDGRVVVIGAHA